jgi:hypothetical protein
VYRINNQVTNGAHHKKLFPTFQQALCAIFQTRVVCRDHVCHRGRRAGTGDTGQCLEPITRREPVNEFFLSPRAGSRQYVEFSYHKDKMITKIKCEDLVLKLLIS